jgi:8-oxo-dGTP pyrophosphatase MutT (NUDIX family)
VSGEGRGLTRERILALTAANAPRRIDLDGYRRAAVLVPLLCAGGAWQLLLTRRTEDLEHHRGQVSFPGGAMDAGESPEQAALRESWEEISLEPERITVAGRLDERWTPTGFVITPVIGLLDPVGGSADGLAANPAEVSRIFTAPLAHFADERNAERRTLMVDGRARDVIFYSYDGETVWGATAFIIRDLLALLGLRAAPDPFLLP